MPNARLVFSLASTILLAAACAGPEEGSLASDAALGPLDGSELVPAELERVTLGAQAPDFRLAALGGDRVQLSDFRGNQDVVLVFFRGHW